VVAGAGHESIEVRCRRAATSCGLDGDRLYAWSRVIAPMVAIAHLTQDGPQPAIDELVTPDPVIPHGCPLMPQSAWLGKRRLAAQRVAGRATDVAGRCRFRLHETARRQ
jgi:hypothetical protein